MSLFDEQTGSFNYSFNVSTQTGNNVSWQLHLGYSGSQESEYSNPSLLQNINNEIGSSYSIDQSNDYLYIGNPESGIVDVFKNDFFVNDGSNVFTKQNRLMGANHGDISGFGAFTKGTEKVLFVSAPYSSNNEGAIFSFNVNLTGQGGATGLYSWNQRHVISGATGQSGYFGSCIDIVPDSSEYLVSVSATGEGSGSGCVYLYDQDGRRFLKKLEHTGHNVSGFGKSFSFCEVEDIRYLAIGYDQGGTGKINTYKESNPREKDFEFFSGLESSNSHYEDMFGYFIDSAEDAFLVAAPKDNQSGAAYYYSFDNDQGDFLLRQKITPSGLAYGDNFGKNVSFDNVDAIITSDKNSGQGYLYYNDNGNWTGVSEVTGGNNTISGSFGGSISGSFATSLLGDVVVVGSSSESSTYYFSTGDLIEELITGMSFSGHKGKLYDSDGHFIYGYKSQKQFEVKGTVRSGDYNIYIGDHLYNAYIQKPNMVFNWLNFDETGNLFYYDASIYTVEL